MRCISLHQPWASLMWLRAKRFETRGWWTGYRGPIAIHAAKLRTREYVELCGTEPFKSVLAAGGFAGFDDLPRGCIICYGDLSDCIGTKILRGISDVTDQERAFGNWSDGRWAWRIDDVVRLANEIQFVGRQGWFNVPDELLRYGN